jgi:hypothetical protein
VLEIKENFMILTPSRSKLMVDITNAALMNFRHLELVGKRRK